ncbi:hypothetical protein [Neomoorella thermoacetica]|uniref:hypothetical protein n=1 Tax=Neomoorella thermoacetica TaxID=1525 RepID=UPI0030D31663
MEMAPGPTLMLPGCDEVFFLLQTRPGMLLSWGFGLPSAIQLHPVLPAILQGPARYQ